MQASEYIERGGGISPPQAEALHFIVHAGLRLLGEGYKKTWSSAVSDLNNVRAGNSSVNETPFLELTDYVQDHLKREPAIGNLTLLVFQISTNFYKLNYLDNKLKQAAK